MGYHSNLETVRLLGGAAVAGCVLALVWALGIVTPVYVSDAEILVQPMAAPAFESSASGGDVNPGHERELIHSGGVAQLVKNRLNTTTTVEELRSRVGVAVVGSTRMLDLSFKASSPTEAQRGAAAYADAYLELKRGQVEAIQDQRRDSIRSALEPIEDDLDSAHDDLGSVGPATGEGLAAQARVDDLEAQAAPYHEKLAETQVVNPDDVGSVVSPASRPGGPVHPRPLLYGLAGAVLGLGAGAALILGRARLDQRLAGRDDLEEHLGAPVLATVPRARRRRAGAAPVTVEQADSRTSDAYRALRVRLLALARKRPIKTVLVASPAGDMGTATVAANLVASLSQAGKDVVLISTDEIDLRTAGSLPAEEMRDLLAERGRGHDFVVVDAPPVLEAAECLALAPLVDAVVVVAALHGSTREDVAQARRQLDEVGADVVGGVLSNARGPGPI